MGVAGVRQKPPFRADHVGSLLRPPRLKAAREALLGPQSTTANLGPHDNPELRAVEDDCIREAIALQERAGLKLATDGELRRRSWWLELIMGWDGFAADRQGAAALTWRDAQGNTQPFSRVWINGPIRRRTQGLVPAFEFLNQNTRLVPKVTLPAPMMIHLFAGGDRGVLEGAYGSLDAFWQDVVDAYRGEIAALISAGARYIQLDDTAIAFLCDPTLRPTFEAWGNEPGSLLLQYAEVMNRVLAGFSDQAVFTLHQCRGNREGHWAAEGGYDPVADVLFNRIDVSGYFLEYDTQRAGTFEPLRLLPKGKTAVLGVMSSKTAELESADFLKRRIEEAGRFADLDQLAVSPQCGFSSSVGGNPLTLAEQETKLARLAEVAVQVWGD